MSIFMGLGLHWLWVLIHAVQLIIHLPIFSVLFPGLAKLFYEQLITIATFNLVETSGFVPYWFSLNPLEEAYSPEFERLAYESQNFLMNIGGIFIMVCIILALAVISLILRVLRNTSEKIDKASKFLNGFLYWNLIFRWLL